MNEIVIDTCTLPIALSAPIRRRQLLLSTQTAMFHRLPFYTPAGPTTHPVSVIRSLENSPSVQLHQVYGHLPLKLFPNGRANS